MASMRAVAVRAVQALETAGISRPRNEIARHRKPTIILALPVILNIKPPAGESA